MPLARIDLVRGKSADYKRTIGDVVYEAIVDILKAPVNDRFQVITEHAPESHIADEGYLGIKRTQDACSSSSPSMLGAAWNKRRSSTKRWRMVSTSGLACAAKTCSSIWSKWPRRTGLSAMAWRNT